MMYVFLNSSNLPEIVSQSVRDAFVDGEVYDGRLCRILTESIQDISSFMKNHYYSDTDKNFKLLPSKPSEYHTWEPLSESWTITVENINKSKEIIFSKIEQLRQEKEQSNILYDGKNLQVNSEAQKNITQKLAELRNRLELMELPVVESLFWKDADNIIHTWNNLNKTLAQNTQDYFAWLQGLQIAASTRGTILYTVAWQKKADITALINITDILSYDITSGW